MNNRLHFSLLLAVALLSQTARAAEDLALLAGKWSVKKVSEEGQNFMQTISVTKDKFVFQILGPEDRVILHAEGDLKLDKVGPFKAAHFVNIRAGESTSDMQNVEDEYTSIYSLDGDTWTMAAGFDKVRDRQKPSLDIYRRVQANAGSKTLVIDEIQMADTPQTATWFLCFEAKAEGVVRKYNVEGNGFDKNQVTVPVRLELPGIKAGQKCSFTLKLDDVEEDVCTEEVDNKSTGEFLISDKGAQSFKPEDNWRYTIRWHLK
jgi:hypothetical protein